MRHFIGVSFSRIRLSLQRGDFGNDENHHPNHLVHNPTNNWLTTLEAEWDDKCSLNEMMLLEFVLIMFCFDYCLLFIVNR